MAPGLYDDPTICMQECWLSRPKIPAAVLQSGAQKTENIIAKKSVAFVSAS